MPYTISLSGKSFTFKDVKEVLAKANEVKSGDTLFILEKLCYNSIAKFF